MLICLRICQRWKTVSLEVSLKWTAFPPEKTSWIWQLPAYRSPSPAPRDHFTKYPSAKVGAGEQPAPQMQLHPVLCRCKVLWSSKCNHKHKLVSRGAWWISSFRPGRWGVSCLFCLSHTWLTWAVEEVKGRPWLIKTGTSSYCLCETSLGGS